MTSHNLVETREEFLEKGSVLDESGRHIMASSEDEKEEIGVAYYSSSSSGESRKTTKKDPTVLIVLLVVCCFLLLGMILLVVLCTGGAEEDHASLEKDDEESQQGNKKVVSTKVGNKRCNWDDRGVVFPVTDPEIPAEKWKYNADAWDRVLNKRWEDGSFTPADFVRDRGNDYALISQIFHSFKCKIHNHLFFEKHNLPGPQVIGWAGDDEALEKVIGDLTATDYAFKVTQLMDAVGVLIVKDGKVANDFNVGDLIHHQFKESNRVSDSNNRLTKEDVAVLKSFGHKGNVVEKDMLLKLGKVLLKADRSTWNGKDAYTRIVHPGIIVEELFDAESEIKLHVVLGKVWGYTAFHYRYPRCQAQTSDQVEKSKALAEKVAILLGVDFVRVDIAINSEGEPQIVEITLQPGFSYSIAQKVDNGRFPKLINWHKRRNQELRAQGNYVEKTGPPEHLSKLEQYWPQGQSEPNVWEPPQID